ncbi:MAG: 16S rRNA processing protein RimM [Mogibacterium sp.]|nr:16S rRNA processing protein RimM [Mogibacterium sp.]
MKKTNKTNETVLIGKVGSPVGIKGEVRITLYAQDSTNLKEGKVLLLERAGKTMSAAIERLRFQKDRPVVKLEGVDDRNAAEEIRGMEVSIYASDLEELPEGEHYVRDLIGCRVVDVADNNREVGVLKDVIQNTAQSILEVETAEGKSVLIPAVDAFLRDIDEEAGVIEVELIPGFLD